MAPEAAPWLLVLVIVMLMAMLVSGPGTSLPNLADLLVVAAGDLQDVQVDVDKYREHREEAHAENDYGHRVDDGEKGTEAIVADHLQLLHHD